MTQGLPANSRGSAGWTDNEPCLFVSLAPLVKCAKCGADVTAPGRLMVKTPGMKEPQVFCDCITDAEIDAICADFERRVIREDDTIDA